MSGITLATVEITLKESKEQWNHRVRVELADGMREVQQKRQGNYTMRELTEEAIELYLKFNGIKVKGTA